MKKGQSRRNFLKYMGAVPVGLYFSNSLLGKTLLNPEAKKIIAPNTNFLLNKDIQEKDFEVDYKKMFPSPGRQVTCITIGAGNRGNVHSGYAINNPNDMKIVGVAEPIAIRRERFSKKYNILKEHQFYTWEDVFKVDKFADAVIITTPDDLHYGPAMAALKMGYDLLLEKPIAQSWKECNDILKLAQKNKRIVAVCHVLRYAPYYIKIKEELKAGNLGKIISMQHMEPVQHVHMSHSYVRGNWRKLSESNPIIISKSCHDLDIMRWWLDAGCKYVSSFGALSYFKSENAPAGSTMRCTDGCKVESTCPFSALRIYYRKRTYLHHFDLPENKEEQGDAIMKNIKEGPYGRCVFHCDNDVCDHQVLSLEFENKITANFNLEAFTPWGGRRTRIMGTAGFIEGDEDVLFIANFSTGEQTKWNVKDNADITSGHGGGDEGLDRNFILAVAQQNPNLLTSLLDVSMESHLMGFRAEESRLANKIMKVDMKA